MIKRINKILLLTFIICLLFVSGCHYSGKYKYSESSKYQVLTSKVSFKNDEIRKIDIDWIVGDISIEVSDTFTLEEQTDSDLDNKYRLHYYLNNYTLYIKYFKSGVSTNKDIDKSIKIQIPENVNLNEIEIDTITSKLEINNIKTKYLNINCINGTHDLYFDTLPDKIELDTINSSTNIYVLPTASILVDIDTINGNINSELDGKFQNGRYIIGTGNSKIELDSINGSLNIKLK